MIVVLILTTIVVGLAFSVLALVQKQMTAIQQNLNKSQEIQRLETSLWVDFNRYPQSQFNEMDRQLVFSSELDSMHYNINKEMVIKDRDTFRVAVTQLSKFLEGNRIEEGSLDALKLEMMEKELTKTIFVFKHDQSKTFMD